MKPTVYKRKEAELLDAKIQQLAKIPGLYQFVMDNCFIAGGAVRDVMRGAKPKDYDLFFYTEEGKSQFIEKFSRHFIETGIGNFNYDDFQFITLYTGTPEQVVNTFDWNFNQMYYEPKKCILIAYNSNGGFLRFNTNARKPLSAYLRLPEMLEKGFKIEKEEMMFLISFLSQTQNLRTGTDLSEQFEFVSSGGGWIGSGKAEEAVKRATEEAVKHSPLYKAMK